jgi:hypothetical protein
MGRSVRFSQEASDSPDFDVLCVTVYPGVAHVGMLKVNPSIHAIKFIGASSRRYTEHELF